MLYKIKYFFGEQAKKLLSFRLVEINESLLRKNKDIIYSSKSECGSDEVWGSNANLDEDDKYKEYYSGFQSESKVMYIELPGDKYYFKNNHLTDRFGRVYYEEGVKYIPALSKFNKIERIKLVGTCAYLSNTEPQHFGHFIMFVLSLISKYKELSKNKPDFYYLGDIKLREFHIKLLGLAGVTKDQIITTPCSADKILYCSITRKFKVNNKKYWDSYSYNYVRAICDQYISRSNIKKIYVSRGDVKWRNIVNERVLISILLKKGFEVVSMDGKTLEEQISIFSGAKVIVAGHGAALTNLLYCNKETKVIELFPCDYPDVTSYVFSSYSGCEYYRLEGDVHDIKTKSCYRDIKINTRKLNELLNVAGV